MPSKATIIKSPQYRKGIKYSKLLTQCDIIYYQMMGHYNHAMFLSAIQSHEESKKTFISLKKRYPGSGLSVLIDEIIIEIEDDM